MLKICLICGLAQVINVQEYIDFKKKLESFRDKDKSIFQGNVDLIIPQIIYISFVSIQKRKQLKKINV